MAVYRTLEMGMSSYQEQVERAFEELAGIPYNEFFESAPGLALADDKASFALAKPLASSELPSKATPRELAESLMSRYGLMNCDEAGQRQAVAHNRRVAALFEFALDCGYIVRRGGRVEKETSMGNVSVRVSSASKEGRRLGFAARIDDGQEALCADIGDAIFQVAQYTMKNIRERSNGAGHSIDKAESENSVGLKAGP
jgi:hypothetical protein